MEAPPTSPGHGTTHPNQSHGVFVAKSAVSACSPGELHKLYYQTSSKTAFKGQSLSEEERAENFDAIHKMGQKNTKYMQYQIKKAPLVDRTACKYTQEFSAKPLGDHQFNKELALTFRGSTRVYGAAGNVDFGLRSKYTEDFHPHSPEEMRLARSPSQKPSRRARTQTLGGTGDQMVFRSSSHEDHRPLHSIFGKAEKAAQPKTNLLVGGAGDAYRSQYRDDFCGPAAVAKRLLKQSSSAPAIAAAPPPVAPPAGHEEELPPPPGLDLANDAAIFNIRRCCYLSPGN